MNVAVLNFLLHPVIGQLISLIRIEVERRIYQYQSINTCIRAELKQSRYSKMDTENTAPRDGENDHSVFKVCHHLLHNVEALSYVLKDTLTQINKSKTVTEDDCVKVR